MMDKTKIEWAESLKQPAREEQAAGMFYPVDESIEDGDLPF